MAHIRCEYVKTIHFVANLPPLYAFTGGDDLPSTVKANKGRISIVINPYSEMLDDVVRRVESDRNVLDENLARSGFGGLSFCEFERHCRSTKGESFV